MKLEIDFSNELLEKLKLIQKEFGVYPYMVLNGGDESTVKELIELIFDKVNEWDRIQKARYLDLENRCACGHTSSYHSPLGDRVCTRCDCYCLKYEEKEMARA